MYINNKYCTDKCKKHYCEYYDNDDDDYLTDLDETAIDAYCNSRTFINSIFII